MPPIRATNTKNAANATASAAGEQTFAAKLVYNRHSLSIFLDFEPLSDSFTIVSVRRSFTNFGVAAADRYMTLSIRCRDEANKAQLTGANKKGWCSSKCTTTRDECGRKHHNRDEANNH